jgi:uncharacterized membrane protein YsdA (DUF1294 family)
MIKKVLLIIIIGLNVYSFAVVGMDKANAADKTGQRTAEVQLVALSSLGAAPGTLLGFKLFNHKTNFDRKAYLQKAIRLVLIQNIMVYFLMFLYFRKKEKSFSSERLTSSASLRGGRI